MDTSNKYYKIVTPYSFFTDFYKNTVTQDVFNIPNGTILTAPETPLQTPDDPKCLINTSCFHFARGAFDTMLWHTRLIHHKLASQIYEIRPLGPVIKQRCADSIGIYQYGATQIKFLNKQNIDDMYDHAIREYHRNQKKYTNFEINLDSWKKHESTVLYLYKCFCR